RSWFEAPDCGSLAPNRDKQLGDRAIRGDDEADEQERAEGHVGADLAEEAAGGLRDSAAHDSAGGISARHLPRQTEERDDDDDPTEDGQHRLAADEAEPKLQRDRAERQGYEPRRPPEQSEERSAPPLQHRALISGQRDGGQKGEREDGDRADLV